MFLLGVVWESFGDVLNVFRSCFGWILIKSRKNFEGVLKTLERVLTDLERDLKVLGADRHRYPARLGTGFPAWIFLRHGPARYIPGKFTSHPRII